METEFAIGIDFGTSNSCIAIFRNNSYEVVRNKLGLTTTPSCVSYLQNNVFVGRSALSKKKNFLKTQSLNAKDLLVKNSLIQKSKNY